MLASCAGDELIDGAADGMVTFTAQLPAEISSRAFADGTTATTLQYAVYEVSDGQATYLSNMPTADVSITGLKANVSIKLVKGKTYNVAFWASAFGSEANNAPYTFNKANSTITIATTGDANAENRDAFFGTSGEFTVEGAVSRTVTLSRPFAQINIGTNDLTEFGAGGGSISTSGITVTAPTQLNLLTGEASDPKEQTFTATALPTDNEFPITGNTYLTMNYVLVGADKTNVDLKWTSDNAKASSVPFTAIPVQRNYRTNIYGSLLTSPQNFDVEVKPGIDGSTPIEYDSEGFRVSQSVEDVNALFAAGEEAVVIDGENVAAATARSRASVADAVKFILNKSLAHQRLKINGKAENAFAVTYPETSSDNDVAAPKFTLVITEEAAAVELDLPDATVEVNGRQNEQGEKATISNITITNAAAATVSGEVTVEEIKKGDNVNVDVEFKGETEYYVTDVATFMSAITGNVATIVIPEKVTIDLKDQGKIVLTDERSLIINGSLNTGRNQLNVDGAVLNVDGIGELTSKGLENKDGQFAIYAYGGSTLNIKNVSIETESNLGGSAICTVNSDLVMENVSVNCHAFTVGANGGTFYAKNCQFESDANNQEGKFTYAVSVTDGCIATFDNCNVIGVQGGVSIGDENSILTINGGEYKTYVPDRFEGKVVAFYPIYIYNKGVVVINSGNFISGYPQKYTIFNGNNDVPEKYTWGNGANLRGGKYNGPTLDQNSKTAYPAAEGYKWVEIADDPVFQFEVVKD